MDLQTPPKINQEINFTYKINPLLEKDGKAETICIYIHIKRKQYQEQLPVTIRKKYKYIHIHIYIYMYIQKD